MTIRIYPNELRASVVNESRMAKTTEAKKRKEANDRKLADVCLNCERSYCNGICDDIRKVLKEIYNRGENGER